MLIHDGVEKPVDPPPLRQPLAAPIDKPSPNARTIVHREISKRMAGDPSLVPGQPGAIPFDLLDDWSPLDRQRGAAASRLVLVSVETTGRLHIIRKVYRRAVPIAQNHCPTCAIRSVPPSAAG